MHCITGLRTARLIHLSRRSLLTGLGIGTVALLAATTPASVGRIRRHGRPHPRPRDH